VIILNNKGMALSSILYTLLVLFLALLFGILGIIPSGNFTLNKLKNDIITKLDNGIIDNSTINYVCRKAIILHTEECMQTDSEKYCSGAGHTKTGSKKTTTITYGQIGTNGSLASGDAFDCDVNSEGVRSRYGQDNLRWTWHGKLKWIDYDEKPTPTYKYAVGDVVDIDGVYVSSNSTEKLVPKITRGTITRIVEGARNPYLLDDGNIGWVNDECIIPYADACGQCPGVRIKNL
jgi:hypothetical protein